MRSAARLQCAPFESIDPHVVLIETFGLPRDAIGEDPQVVMEALCDDIEVLASFHSRLFHFSANVQKTSVHLLFQPLEAPIHRPEAAVHRLFESGDGHGFS